MDFLKLNPATCTKLLSKPWPKCKEDGAAFFAEASKHLAALELTRANPQVRVCV